MSDATKFQKYGDRCWHFCDTPTSPCEVRSPGCPGRHLLRLSHSDFEASAEVIVL
jgi:hypothetical protein